MMNLLFYVWHVHKIISLMNKNKLMVILMVIASILLQGKLAQIKKVKNIS